MNFPENVRPIEQEARFNFRCHAGLNCFTDCCRELELVLSPYDVLRLRETLKLDSREFLDRHTVIEFENNDQFPRVYLGMVDDGKASCPFVTPKGCILYQHRPGACRTYPVGRGASMVKDKKIVAKYILLKEPHCQGFTESQQQTINEWEQDQDIKLYNKYNDLLMSISQHPKIKTGMRLSQNQAELFITTLYDQDQLRADLVEKKEQDLMGYSLDELVNDNSLLLTYAIQLLSKKLF